VGNETGANPEKITLALSTGASYQLVSPSAATITILSQQQVAITKAPAGMTLTWDSVVGQVYHVATKTDLTAPWNDLSGGITATGASTSWTDTSAAISAQRLYAVYTPGS
jgi:hypothetical protein